MKKIFLTGAVVAFSVCIMSFSGTSTVNTAVNADHYAVNDTTPGKNKNKNKTNNTRNNNNNRTQTPRTDSSTQQRTPMDSTIR